MPFYNTCTHTHTHTHTHQTDFCTCTAGGKLSVETEWKTDVTMQTSTPWVKETRHWTLATYIRCAGIFKYEFGANLPLSLPAKEFWKSVDISGSYGQEFSVLFTARCIRGTSHGPVSVRLSQVGVLSKGMNESSWFLACELPSTHPTLC